MPTLEELEEQAMLLPERSRLELAGRLWGSVAMTEDLFTPGQSAEFERRAEEFEQGLATTYSHEEVMQGARSLLRSR